MDLEQSETETIFPNFSREVQFSRTPLKARIQVLKELKISPLPQWVMGLDGERVGFEYFSGFNSVRWVIWGSSHEQLSPWLAELHQFLDRAIGFERATGWFGGEMVEEPFDR